MTPAQMEKFRAAMAVRSGHEWDKFEGLGPPPETIEAFLARVPFAAGGPRRFKAPPLEVPEALHVAIQPVMATQTGFGAILNELGRERLPLSERYRPISDPG
jgi:pyruvate dehydrogenase E1 component